MHFLNTDGGARGNPGPSAIAFVLRDNNVLVASEGEFIGTATNNVAEYKALIKGVGFAKSLGVRDLTCYIDSELVVKQLNGQYRVKDENLKKLFKDVKALVLGFKSILFIPATRYSGGISRMIRMILQYSGTYFLNSTNSLISSFSLYGLYFFSRYKFSSPEFLITCTGYIFSWSGLNLWSAKSFLNNLMSFLGLDFGRLGIIW